MPLNPFAVSSEVPLTHSLTHSPLYTLRATRRRASNLLNSRARHDFVEHTLDRPTIVARPRVEQRGAKYVFEAIFILRLEVPFIRKPAVYPTRLYVCSLEEQNSICSATLPHGHSTRDPRSPRSRRALSN